MREKGVHASQAGKYRASKTLAERAAWDFVEKNKGSIAWDLVVLNPPMVFGPAIHEVGAPEALNESMHNWFHSVFRGSQDPKQLGTLGYVGGVRKWGRKLIPVRLVAWHGWTYGTSPTPMHSPSRKRRQAATESS